MPAWKLLLHTPAVFVRVASKGFAGYGTWKSVRKMEDSDGCNVGTSRPGRGLRSAFDLSATARDHQFEDCATHWGRGRRAGQRHAGLKSGLDSREAGKRPAQRTSNRFVVARRERPYLVIAAQQSCGVSTITIVSNMNNPCAGVRAAGCNGVHFKCHPRVALRNTCGAPLGELHDLWLCLELRGHY